MPGLLSGSVRAAGVKIINAALGNVDLGLPRADGLTMLLDLETARPVALMDGALISATRRWARSSSRCAEACLSQPSRAKRCGGRAARVRTARTDTAAAPLRWSTWPPTTSARRWPRRSPTHTAHMWWPPSEHRHAGSAGEAIAGADLVVTVTTVTEGYVRHA